MENLGVGEVSDSENEEVVGVGAVPPSTGSAEVEESVYAEVAAPRKVLERRKKRKVAEGTSAGDDVEVADDAELVARKRRVETDVGEGTLSAHQRPSNMKRFRFQFFPAIKPSEPTKQPVVQTSQRSVSPSASIPPEINDQLSVLKRAMVKTSVDYTEITKKCAELEVEVKARDKKIEEMDKTIKDQAALLLKESDKNSQRDLRMTQIEKRFEEMNINIDHDEDGYVYFIKSKEEKKKKMLRIEGSKAVASDSSNGTDSHASE